MKYARILFLLLLLIYLTYLSIGALAAVDKIREMNFSGGLGVILSLMPKGVEHLPTAYLSDEIRQ